MKKLYPQGFQFEYGGLKFEKLQNSNCSWWICLNSYYLEPIYVDEELQHVRIPESQKPLYKSNGELNRWSFKSPDIQVQEKYKL